jgi:hypothetical protein
LANADKKSPDAV